MSNAIEIRKIFGKIFNVLPPTLNFFTIVMGTDFKLVTIFVIF